MALSKSVTNKGVTGTYWQIYKNTYDKDSNKTLSRMRCYVDKTTRDGNIEHFIDMPDFKVNRWFDGELSIANTYNAWKNPIYVLDEEGNPTEEDTNVFTTAQDVLEE